MVPNVNVKIVDIGAIAILQIAQNVTMMYVLNAIVTNQT